MGKEIMNGVYATLHNDKVYQITNFRLARKTGEYKLRSTCPNDLKNGFKKIDQSYMKTVNAREIKEIESIHTYAILKNDPDENKFEILLVQKNIIILSIEKPTENSEFDKELKNLGFKSCSYDSGILIKKFPIDEVEFNYEKKPIFFDVPKDTHHSRTKAALIPMSKTMPGHTQELSSKEQDLIAFS